MSNETYEDKYPELEELLNKNRVRWQLDSINWMDYDDVCQMIRLHIFKKWHLWDQTRAFKPWASQIISNQIKNMIRNNYSNYAKPCLRCPHYLGHDGCSFTSNNIQTEECDLFAKWRSKKEKVYNLKMPMPIEDSLFLGETYLQDNINYDVAKNKLHDMVMSQLNDKHRKIYYMLYIEHATEEDVAKQFNFKGDKSKRKTIRYKQIGNLQKKFFAIAEQIIKDNDIL